MSRYDPRDTAPRNLEGSIEVKCPWPTCDNVQTMTQKQRNDPKIVMCCDGKYGARHRLEVMRGPEGKPYA